MDPPIQSIHDLANNIRNGVMSEFEIAEAFGQDAVKRVMAVLQEQAAEYHLKAA